jgi:hypothetical protein
LVMRDTCLVATVLLERGASFTELIVEAMKHLEGPAQFLLMNLYCMGIQDAFPLTPANMQFPNTVLGILTALFAFLLMRRLFNERTAYFTAIAFALTPWIAAVIRMTQYFNMLSMLFHFSTAYFLVGLMSEPKSRLWRIMAPLSLSVYLFSSLDWHSYLLFVAVFFIFSGKLFQILRNPYNIIVIVAIVPLLAWDALLYMKYGIAGLYRARSLYAFMVSSGSASSVTAEAIWHNEILGWGPLMVAAFGGLAFYLFRERNGISSDRITRSLLDACALWLLWATAIVFMTGGHSTYLYVLGMPAAIFSGLLLSKIPIRPVVAIIIALSVFQVGVTTDWQFGLKTDERRRVLAAACFLIESRPDLLGPDRTLLAVDCRRGRTMGEKGLGGAVAQYARPQKKPLIIPDYYLVTGRVFGQTNDPKFDEIIETYNRTGILKADGVIMESEAVSETNPASKFWARLMEDPNIRWMARFREDGGEIFIGEVRAGKGAALKDAPELNVKSLSHRYLEKYDRLSFLRTNMKYVRTYFTSVLSK